MKSNTLTIPYQLALALEVVSDSKFAAKEGCFAALEMFKYRLFSAAAPGLTGRRENTIPPPRLDDTPSESSLEGECVHGEALKRSEKLLASWEAALPVLK